MTRNMTRNTTRRPRVGGRTISRRLGRAAHRAAVDLCGVCRGQRLEDPDGRVAQVAQRELAKKKNAK